MSGLPQWLRFCMVGTVGFAVDTALLYAALACGLGFLSGRILSFLSAMACTWLLNRQFTFNNRRENALLEEFLRYALAMTGGGMVNYGVYGFAILVMPGTRFLPLLAVGCGSLAGLTVNFLAAKLWVYRKSRS